MREVRSRRLVPRAERAPVYARVLGLQYIRPSGLLCFALFEGTITLSALLALAEQVTWWAVPILPAVVAAAVKIDDIVAGALRRTGNAAWRSGRQRVQPLRDR